MLDKDDLPQKDQGKPAKPGQKPLPKTDPTKKPQTEKGIYLERLGMGYYPGDPASRQILLNQLDQLCGELGDALQLKFEERPLLIIYQDENGQYITGKDLLESLGDQSLFEGVVEVYRKAETTKELMIHFKHMNLYSEPAELHLKGRAANGSYFRATAEDEKDFRTFFDFIPRPADQVVPLVPYMPGAPVQ